MSFIFVSDLHIKPASSYRKNLLAGDSFYALDQLEREALDRKVSAVILGGDVTDCNQPHEEVRIRLKSFVEKMKAGGTTVYFIEGNHDKVHKNPYLQDRYYEEHRIMSSVGAIPLNGGKFTISGLVFRGIDYCPSERLREKLETLEECDVLILHTPFKHLLGFEGSYDMELQFIPPAVKRAVMVGDVHVRSETTYTIPSGNEITVFSPGSTWVVRVDEADKKHGFYVFQDDLSYEHIELDCRKYFDIDCEQDIIDTMTEDHALEPVLRYIRENLPTLDHAKYPGVKLVPMSADSDVEEMLDMADNESADLTDALFIGVPPDEYPAEYSFMKALLGSEDPPGFLAEWLAERKALLKETA